MRLAVGTIDRDALAADVRAVRSDESSLWTREILDRLAWLKPETYGKLTIKDLGRALAAAGIVTAPLHRRINGRGFTRRGVRFDARGEPVSAVWPPRGRRAYPPVVYFAERDGFVKIGFTKNLRARLMELDRRGALEGMTDTPVTLLASMPGDLSVERSVHELFHRLRYEGEWFLHEPPLVGFIESVAEASR